MSKTNIYGSDIVLDSYRRTIINTTNFNTDNCQSGVYGPFGVGGPPNTDIYYTNSLLNNFSGTFFILYFQLGSKHYNFTYFGFSLF